MHIVYLLYFTFDLRDSLTLRSLGSITDVRVGGGGRRSWRQTGLDEHVTTVRSKAEDSNLGNATHGAASAPTTGHASAFLGSILLGSIYGDCGKGTGYDNTTRGCGEDSARQGCSDGGAHGNIGVLGKEDPRTNSQTRKRKERRRRPRMPFEHRQSRSTLPFSCFVYGTRTVTNEDTFDILALLQSIESKKVAASKKLFTRERRV
eukprot:scaffold1314_cov158-Amphora_coffeaeformis.AAC.12